MSTLRIVENRPPYQSEPDRCFVALDKNHGLVTFAGSTIECDGKRNSVDEEC